MKLSQILSLSTAVAGTITASRILTRRHQWEQTNKQAIICLDFADAQAAAIRAGLNFDALLSKIAANGATHLSLPELTLNLLLAEGQLAPQAPAKPLTEPAPVGHWNYLHGRSPLIHYLAQELNGRLPYTQAQILSDTTLVFAGNLPTIGSIGLGFDDETAQRIATANLGIVPRPVSYDWPEKALIERTVAQAAQYGRFLAFDGNMILGHEMHLEETREAMAEHNLTYVYFVESRHQRGDWHFAKRSLPRVILGHRFTPERMMELDGHAAAHNWVQLANDRGIRFCYINFFRVLHATEPLEGLGYIHHLKHALEDAGYSLSQNYTPPQPAPTPEPTELALSGLATAGTSAAAVTSLLNLPETVAVPLTAVALTGAAALPFVEQKFLQPNHHHHSHSHDHDHHHDHHHHHDHSHHHHHDHDHGDMAALFPPSYTPKLLGLTTTSLSPIATLSANEDGLLGLMSGLVYQTAAATSLAAVTSGHEYQQRVEEYRSFNLDWALPLAAAALKIPNATLRGTTLATLTAGWVLAYQKGLDPLAQFDPSHAEGHTHHVSAATRLIGDTLIAIGPNPARKWTGLGVFGYSLSGVLARNGRHNLATAAALAGTAGSLLGLVGFRRPERALTHTSPQAINSLAAGTALALATLLLEKVARD